MRLAQNPSDTRGKKNQNLDTAVSEFRYSACTEIKTTQVNFGDSKFADFRCAPKKILARMLIEVLVKTAE